MVASEPPVSEAEKREALESALSSTAFARSVQLQALLKYVCEMEIAGRSGELTEYLIATEVLGHKNVSLSDDSSVRDRAYELRQRLEELYASEQTAAQVRIEIPRGGYTPVFARHSATALAVAPAAIVMPPPPAAARPRIGMLLALVAVACGLAGWGIGAFAGRPHPSEILDEAWGPLADPAADPLVAIASNLHLLIRPHIPPRPGRLAAPPELYPLFKSTRPLDDTDKLYMEPAQLSIPLDELAAVATLAAVRTRFGGGYQILSEDEAPLPALLGRNSFVLGSPVNSRATTLLLKNVPLTMGFTGDDQFAIIDQRKPGARSYLYVSQPAPDRGPLVLYGLITVLTGVDAAGKPRRTVIFTGAGPAALQAAVEFYSSPERMRELKNRLGGAFPPNYQVVVRAAGSGSRLLSYHYETHIVVEKPQESGR